MKKIIFTCDGETFSEGAFEFVKQIASAEPVLLTGIFLPAVAYSELLYSFGGMVGPIYTGEAVIDEKLLEKNIQYFKAKCDEAGINYKVHSSTTHQILDEIKTESRFADLVVAGGEGFFKNVSDTTPEAYLKEALHRAECPVVVVPEHFEMPERIVIAYDGSANSVQALKQFTYLLPKLAQLNVVVVYASAHSGIPHLERMEELASCHFQNITFYKLDADGRKYFETWLGEQNKIMLVAGAYSRSILSELLQHSFIGHVLEAHKIPVFVSHG